VKIANWWHEKDGKIECLLCPRNCVIDDRQSGFCNVRRNENQTLYTTVYGQPVATHMDPIEKKPLYHFYPGTQIYSVGTVGCNLACEFCQNWDISRASPESYFSKSIPPEKIIQAARQSDSIGIAFTYNEPTIFGEYVLDIALLAHGANLKTVMVTNGYISPQAINDIYPHIDAANIDLKSFSGEFYQRYCKAELRPVLESIEMIKSIGTFVEITTLIIPGLNDGDDEIDQLTIWIVDHLGIDTPLHFSAFHPDYKMKYISRTPKSTLDKAKKIALGNGLRYVYLGNVLSDKDDNTYCYSCGRLLIERQYFTVVSSNLRGNVCSCGAKIAIVQS